MKYSPKRSSLKKLFVADLRKVLHDGFELELWPLIQRLPFVFTLFLNIPMIQNLKNLTIKINY